MVRTFFCQFLLQRQIKNTLHSQNFLFLRDEYFHCILGYAITIFRVCAVDASSLQKRQPTGILPSFFKKKPSGQEFCSSFCGFTLLSIRIYSAWSEAVDNMTEVLILPCKKKKSTLKQHVLQLFLNLSSKRKTISNFCKLLCKCLNVCYKNKYTKRSSVLLLRLVYLFLEKMLDTFKQDKTRMSV